MAAQQTCCSRSQPCIARAGDGIDTVLAWAWLASPDAQLFRGAAPEIFSLTNVELHCTHSTTQTTASHVLSPSIPGVVDTLLHTLRQWQYLV